RRFAALAATLLIAGCAPDRPLSPALARGIDAVFADMDRPGSPGATVSVIRDGEIVFSRGYGYAQIEHGVPVTPTTVFHVASVSKQFTAMAVTLLAAEGALSLDDPVQRHLDFVPHFEHPTTVRQLIHHTSGIRDQWQLLGISGWRLDDVITTEQIVGLMARQRELNFVPGSEYLYSNMGYTLMAQTVEAVSGMSFPEFTAARIFRPLEMDRTHFHDDHRHVVPDRAYSYAPVASGAPADDEGAGTSDASGPRFTKAVLSYANAGATSLFTTADDLARWLDNFRHETVGGPRVMAMMKTRGILNSGDTIPYAHGVIFGEHRGLQTIGHSGGDAGFRTQVNWYPEANTGVVVLTNVANGNPGGRARQVAEVVLADLFPEEPEEDEGGPPTQAPDDEPPETPDPGTLAGYAGSYYSPELDALYHIEAASDGLVARHIRHGETTLQPRAPDEFATGNWWMREVRFERCADGAVTGMRVGGGRVRNLLFVRLSVALPGDESFPEPARPALPVVQAAPAIPERPFAPPTGPHAIGMTEYRWVDESRPEPFTRDPDDLRSVAVRVWYPTDDAREGGAMYVPDMAEFGDGQDFVPVTHVRTNAIQDAAPVPGPFPVLVYNHGGGWTRFTSTFTTEELASHGYIVVSVGHNGFNRTQFLPDGSSVVPDTLTFPEPTGDLYEDAVGGWDFLDEHAFPEWVADAAFAIDQLEVLNAGGGPFAGTMDLDRIGMYGWSFGGATSIEMSSVDERVKAAIDHDGQLFGVAPTQGTTRPFMLMHGGVLPETPPFEDPDSIAAYNDAIERLMADVRDTDARLKAASTGDWYDITIAGTNHGNFSDLVMFLPGSSPDIEPARGYEIINALTVAFFDRYLKGAEAPLLDDPGAVFEEVEAESRVGS
ncbi:MAG: serine hydrolase, partial [Gemmatimonadota bacterium]|nr:serine hydrolase [Gemmatimonadota bacterium]